MGIMEMLRGAKTPTVKPNRAALAGKLDALRTNRDTNTPAAAVTAAKAAYDKAVEAANKSLNAASEAYRAAELNAMSERGAFENAEMLLMRELENLEDSDLVRQFQLECNKAIQALRGTFRPVTHRTINPLTQKAVFQEGMSNADAIESRRLQLVSAINRAESLMYADINVEAALAELALSIDL